MTEASADRGWVRPGRWAAWRASAAFEGTLRGRVWVARRLVTDQYGGEPVLLDADVTGHDGGRIYDAYAYARLLEAEAPTVAPPPEPEPASPDATSTLGQRLARGVVNVAIVAVAVALLVALVVPGVRGTVALYLGLATVGVVGVALARRYHGLRWARRAYHAQQRSRVARRARRVRVARQQANSARHATLLEQRTTQAATAREARREANRARHWQHRSPPLPASEVGERGETGDASGGVGESVRGRRAHARREGGEDG